MSQSRQLYLGLKFIWVLQTKTMFSIVWQFRGMFLMMWQFPGMFLVMWQFHIYIFQCCECFQLCSYYCDGLRLCFPAMFRWHDSFQLCAPWYDSFKLIFSSYVFIDVTVSNPCYSSYVFIDVTVSNSCFPAMFLLMWQFPHMSNLCDSFQIGSSKHDNLQLWFPGFKFMWQFSQQSLVVYDTKISNVVSCVWGFHCTRGFDILNITKGNFYIDIIQPIAFYY